MLIETVESALIQAGRFTEVAAGRFTFEDNDYGVENDSA
jgi:hypothetical protein